MNSTTPFSREKLNVLSILFVYIFVGPADALAEFVDNSIQHGIGSDRSININVHLSSNDTTSSYIVISDNGSGMTADDIKAFATFALDRRTRQILPSNPGEGTSISKFGVGAKQAGFYLGSNIAILTKTRSVDHVLTFVMDEEEFEQRHQGKQSLYTGNINTYSNLNDYEAETLERGSWPNPLWDHLHSQAVKENFTSVVVELRAEIASLMSRNYQRVSEELTDIYYFHLHPADLLCATSHAHSSRILSQSQPANTVPILSYQVLVGDRVQLNERLNEVSACRTARYMQNRVEAFSFGLEVPEPNPTVDLSVMNIKTLQITHIRRHMVRGMLLYFPYIDDHETHPLIQEHLQHHGEDVEADQLPAFNV
ncbi:MAG: hypothetical protein EOO63_00245, partial [Hymenobacter sp.]